jgi:hypothetical protein
MARMSRGWACVLLFAGSLGGSGCFANRINTTMRSWEGHHYSDLIMRWGPPQGVYDDGQGGRIFVYTSQRQWTTPGTATTTTTANARVYQNTIWAQAQSFSRFVPPQTQGYTAWRMFRINSGGRIYSWSWRGL